MQMLEAGIVHAHEWAGGGGDRVVGADGGHDAAAEHPAAQSQAHDQKQEREKIKNSQGNSAL